MSWLSSVLLEIDPDHKSIEFSTSIERCGKAGLGEPMEGRSQCPRLSCMTPQSDSRNQNSQFLNKQEPSVGLHDIDIGDSLTNEERTSQFRLSEITAQILFDQRSRISHCQREFKAFSAGQQQTDRGDLRSDLLLIIIDVSSRPTLPKDLLPTPC